MLRRRCRLQHLTAAPAADAPLVQAVSGRF